MRRHRILAAAVATAVAYGQANAETLLIDFNSTTQDNGPHNQAGYEHYDAGHEVAADFVAMTYSAFGATVSVAPAWPDTTDNRVQQMIDRGANFDANYDGNRIDLITDWIGIDTRTGNGGNGDAPNETTMTLMLGGLPAGIYDMLSYHHDTEFVNAEFDITLIDANGTADIGHFHMTASTEGGNINDNQANPGPGHDPDVLSSTVQFQLESNGVEDILIGYTLMGQGNVHNQIWGMNGFELTLVPEPSTVTLMVIGGLLAGVYALRGRRRR